MIELSKEEMAHLEEILANPSPANDRLRALFAGPPATVEWVDGRAMVGDVTVRAFAPYGVTDHGDGRWHFDIFVTLGYGRGHHDAHLAVGEAYDEATAKRIAIAIAREMQR